MSPKLVELECLGQRQSFLRDTNRLLVVSLEHSEARGEREHTRLGRRGIAVCDEGFCLRVVPLGSVAVTPVPSPVCQEGLRFSGGLRLAGCEQRVTCFLERVLPPIVCRNVERRALA